VAPAAAGLGAGRRARAPAPRAERGGRAQCGGKLQRELDGAAFEVFARALRGLAATKLTKPGTFRCADGDGEGHALRCSYKARASGPALRVFSGYGSCGEAGRQHVLDTLERRTRGASASDASSVSVRMCRHCPARQQARNGRDNSLGAAAPGVCSDRLSLADCQLPAPVQADDGYLYPLERAFFYVHKPPTLLVHDEIESIEFMRQGGGVLAASAKTFDLLIRMRNNTARARARTP
jgi:hypothetical protein